MMQQAQPPQPLPQELMQQQPQSRSFGHYIDSNPSSTHSSPRSFTTDLDGFYPTMQGNHHIIPHSQTYPLPAGTTSNPYLPAQQRRPHLHGMQQHQSRSASYSSSYAAPVPLQVSTSTSSAHEHDPNERTARPGNAHVHAQFHSSLAAAASASSSGAGSSSSSSTGDNSNSIATAGTNADDNDASANDYTSSTPGLSAGLTRPLKPIEQERLAHLDKLKFFLATAPSRWDSAASNANPNGQASSSAAAAGFPGGNGDFAGSFGSGGQPGYGGGGVNGAAGGGGGAFPGIGIGMGLEPSYHHAPPHPALNRFLLPNQEFVTCVLWNGLYHITGTDIVRALVFRFEAFGRPVRNMKKFEEGVFSDLRNLKPGVDACLEEPKSPFLDLLFKYQCIRTQKKQKVFYWFSVPHDRLFLDALERDLKREKMGLEPTTQVVGEPALSFTYDPKRSLYEQFSKAHGARDGEGDLETAIRNHEDGESGGDSAAESAGGGDSSMMDDSEHDGGDESGATGGEESDASGIGAHRRRAPKRHSANMSLGPNGQPIFPFLSLFEGSPTYKQRRKKGNKASSLRKASEDLGGDGEYDRGRSMGDGGSGRFSSASRERRLPHMPRASMMEEFGPGSEAEKARQAGEMSAAEMFLKQARGQLVPGDGVVRKPKPQPIVGEVGIFYHQDEQNPARMGHARGSSFDDRLQASMQEPRPPAPPSAGYTTTTFPDPSGQMQTQGLTNISPYEAVSADGKMRAFICPLYSCGRLFKRMEHLKRHMRTHTMERPFPCPRCNKNFSRSDNLTQHLRTHERTGHGATGPGGAPGTGDWMAQGEDGDISGGEGSTNGDSPSGPGSVADSEDEALHPGMLGFQEDIRGLEAMFGDVGMMNVDMPFGGMMGGNVDMHGFPAQMDATMCEVEVPGGVQDLGGDEEGELVRMGGAGADSLIFRNQHSLQPQTADEYYSSLPSSATTSGMLFSASTGSSAPAPADFTEGAQWATRPQSSSRSINPLRNHMHSHSSSSSVSSGFGEDFLSLSAPSHKQSFDHTALYPPGGLDAVNAAGGNVGPMRRHRSMTPSLARNGEPIRRPMTANSEFQGVNGGSPASVSSLSSSRGFHPYAAYSNNNSRSNSTHNSPLVGSVPLGENQHRSESRNSNYGGGGVGGLHDQMRQMMNMDGSSGGAGGNQSNGSPSLFAADGMFRTGSPASFHQTESPATFAIDLPPSNMYGATSAFGHAATMPAGSQFGQQQQQQQQQYDGSYYVQQPHNT
ncbi:hypothetical protein CPC08DRAFT_712232, partial [Agrocybe pediades]